MELIIIHNNDNATFLCTIGLAEVDFQNAAISTELLLEILDWQREGATINDVCAC